MGIVTITTGSVEGSKQRLLEMEMELRVLAETLSIASYHSRAEAAITHDKKNHGL